MREITSIQQPASQNYVVFEKDGNEVVAQGSAFLTSTCQATYDCLAVKIIGMDGGDFDVSIRHLPGVSESGSKDLNLTGVFFFHADPRGWCNIVSVNLKWRVSSCFLVKCSQNKEEEHDPTTIGY